MLSPFRGLRFARLEADNIKASTMMKVAICAIAIIPLLYGALYLWAFLDPYNTLDDVPVAIVNLDEGAKMGDEDINAGQQIVDELKDTSDGMQWNFVDAKTGKEGLENGDYYMMLTIPANFSENIVSADGTDPVKATLQLECNQSSNMLATQIGQTVFDRIQTAATKNVAGQYYDNIFVQINDGADKVQTAADGADDLNDGLLSAQVAGGVLATGLSTASDGSTTLTSGLYQLSTGAKTLDSGVQTLSSGAQVLDSGAQTLNAGVGTLAGGMSQLNSQAGTLASGATQLDTGAQQLSGGTASLAAGIAQVAAGTQTLSDAVGDTSDPLTVSGGVNLLYTSVAGDGTPGSSLVESTGQLAGGAAAVNTGVQGINGILNDSVTYPTDAQKVAAIQGVLLGSSGSSGLLGAAGAVEQGAEDLNVGAGALTVGIGALQVGVNGDGTPGQQTLVSGVNQMNYVMNTDDGSGNSLVTDAATLAGGASTLAQGTSVLSGQVPALVGGVGQLSDGATQLAQGTQTLADSTPGLVQGTQLLADSTPTLVQGASGAYEGSAGLSSGLTQLSDGANTLSEGLGTAYAGSATLATGLHDGVDGMRISDRLAKARSDMMSEPIVTDTSYFTEVKNYGTGFAPYFIPLGMWVGALMIGFVCKPLNGRIVASNAAPGTAVWAGFLPMAAISTLQGLLLGLILQFGLDLTVLHPVQFYLFIVLTGWVFCAIIQMLNAAFGFPGKFIAIILLMLQLTSAAGTFPIECTPQFFQVISPWLPMTHVVAGLRECLTGVSMGTLAGCFGLVALYGIASVIITGCIARSKRTVKMTDIHPLLDL